MENFTQLGISQFSEKQQTMTKVSNWLGVGHTALISVQAY